MVVDAAAEAGIDPRSLMAIMMIEVGRSEALAELDDLAQGGQLLADGMGIYARLVGHPPSLGWGNIQENSFNETKENHPDALGSAEWRDLILDDALAIKVTAYALRDLQDQVTREAPEAILRRYSSMQLAAAAYNIGMPSLQDSYSRGELGPYGTSYSDAMMRRYGQADSIICGRWSC
jgi:hypothetical protein